MTPSPIASFSVANINPGVVRSEFMLSVMALVEKERALGELNDPQVPRVRFDQFYSHFSGPYLDDHRNECSLWFLNHTDSDYLLFIDSDVAFDPNQPYTLIQTAAEHKVSILSGVYYNSFYHLGGVRALIHRWEEDPRFSNARNLIAVPAEDIEALYPQDKPHPIDGCGAGFMAIHRECLLDMQKVYEMPQPFFAELCINGIHMGEDLSFCVRAAAVNHPSYVLPCIEVEHFKTCSIKRPPSPSPQEQSNG